MKPTQTSDIASPDIDGLSMLGQFKKLAGHSAIYGLGLVGSTLAAMILTPMFLHMLARSEYGMVEILNVFSAMLSNLMVLGITSVLIKIYVNDCKDDKERRLLMSSVVIFIGSLALSLVLLSIAFGKPVSTLLFKNGKHAILVQLAVCGSGFLLVQNMAMFCLRAKQWAVKFASLSLIQLTLVIGLNFWFVWSGKMGVLGIQLSGVIASGIAMLIGLTLIRSDLSFRFSKNMMKHVMILALPMIPASTSTWVMNLSDRYFLNHSWGLSTTGLYAVGYKVGMLGVMIIINAFQMAWGPHFISHSDDKDTPRVCASVLKVYVLALTTGGLTLSIFAPEILRIIAKREYWGAGWIVPYIAMSYVFYGVQFFTIPILIRKNQGAKLSLIMGSAAVTNLVLNYILIPTYGISGAITATMASLACGAVASLITANRFYPVQHQFFNYAKLLAVSGIVYLLFQSIAPISTSTFFLKLTFLPAMVLILLIAKFFTPGELEMIQSIPGRVTKRYFSSFQVIQ